jgi:Ca2+:H+ antiporter
VLAVAVTVIEVSLIVTLMLSGGDEAATLARETVFAAAMITVNGILGLSLLVGARRFGTVRFNAEGTGGALATVATLATVCLVLPTVTESQPGPEFTSGQLAFAAVASLALYLAFVVTQTVRHRDFFLPVSSKGKTLTEDEHADPPTTREATVSLGFLLPVSFVGVVIALLVLLPETIAAVNAARRDRIQTSLNLALGSAMASIGLTIPTLAVASIWIPTPLHLGLGATQIVLLAITVVVGVLTVVPGRATRLQGSVHLTLFAAFLFLAMSP